MRYGGGEGAVMSVRGGVREDLSLIHISSGAEVSDYAVVTNAKGANDNGMLGDQAELLFTDGTKKIVDTDQDYSSMTGDLVTFEIEDGEYQLTEANDLTDGSNGNSGFDKKLSSPQYKYVSGGKSTLGGEFIANDAVVFVKDSANKYDVISGAALKRYSSGVNGVIGFADKASNGFNNVVLALSLIHICRAGRQCGPHARG